VHSLREQIILPKNKKHDIDVLVDSILVSEFSRTGAGAQATKQAALERLSEAVERALQESEGLVKIEDSSGERLISAKFMCPYDGFSISLVAHT
jgi:excinuclease UvrABC ATPase subunit